MSEIEATQAPLGPELTPAQAEVVGQLGQGPVKVVAAAGSGKTTTMASVYAAALGRGVAVGQILAVTFTDMAAAELRQRILDRSVGAGLGTEDEVANALQGAWIGTFHRLVRRLLQERSYLASFPRDLVLTDPVESAEIMEQSLEQVRRRAGSGDSWLRLLPPDADPGTVRRLVAAAGSAVERLRSTELEPARCEQLSLVAYSRFQELGDPPEELGWHRLALLVVGMVWEEYERRLELRRALDFDGLLRAGLRALRESPELLGWCRSNFQLVIVDEYQDTSELQESLILELTGPQRRSLFMVGDARQSIYAFRDAKPGIMAEAPGRRFPLFVNHRSRTPILAAADHVIRADPQFAADEPMRASREAEDSLPVFVSSLDDPAREAEAVAEALEQLHRHGITYPNGGHQLVNWSDMAVLARTYRRLGPALEEALRARAIPFRTAVGGLLDRPEVKDLLALLRLVQDESHDLACLRLLQSALVRIPDRGLVPLLAGPEERELALAARLRRHLAAGAPGWEPSWRGRAAWLQSLVGELREASWTVPGSRLLALALRRSGLLRLHQARERGGDPAGRRALASLRELERISRSGSAQGRWLSLDRLLERLDLARDEGRTAEPPAQADEDLVILCTIHRAKGLEWPVVVLADCRPHHARGQGAVIWDRGQSAVITTRVAGKDTAAFTRWKAAPAARVDREEHRRLVYVAMTRARDLLLVTTARAGDRGEFVELAEAAASGFEWVREWPDLARVTRLPWAPDQPSVAGPGPIPGRPRPASMAPAQLARRWDEVEALDRAPEPGQPRPTHLSFTSIDLMNRCPRQFWYSHIAHYPGLEPAPSPLPAGPAGSLSVGSRDRALDLGTAVHLALERVHREVGDRAPTALEAMAALEAGPVELDPEQLELARGMLNGYVAGEVAALPTVALEFAFSWRGWAGSGALALSGIVDRIARTESGGLLVVDYKTNASLSEADLVEYSRQLRIYAAAIQAGALGAPVATPRAALAALRSGRLIEVSTGPEELGQALEWAAEAARRVEAGAYSAREGFPNRPCGDCPFSVRCPERRSESAARSWGA